MPNSKLRATTLIFIWLFMKRPLEIYGITSSVVCSGRWNKILVGELPKLYEQVPKDTTGLRHGGKNYCPVKEKT
jgi:hypothetical protein